jgi:predicted nucleic acid-binding Zn ribbon protein
MTDDPLTSCSTCEAPVERVFHPVAVHFKGSGFYTTDYGKKQPAGASDSTSKPESKDSGDSGKSESGKSESGKQNPAAKGDSGSG